MQRKRTRPATIDKNHTSLVPHRIGVICGFVFTSDQICSGEYLVIGSVVGTCFSHRFGVYSPVFGVYPSVLWFPKHYPNVLILWNIDTA